jgi:hypothetical protein
MRRKPGGNKEHAIELEFIGGGSCGLDMAAVNGVKRSAENSRRARSRIGPCGRRGRR